MDAARLDEPEVAPVWVRRPGWLHLLAYGLATLVLLGQVVAVLLRGPETATVLAVLAAGAGVALSWRWPWTGLALTSATSFAVTAVGQDPLSVWMMAVLVLFSCALRGLQPVVGTLVVAGFFLAAYMTVGGFRGGAVVGCAAVFSAIAGGAAGAALRVYREHWWVLAERARDALASREAEASRRVVEERLRIARDLHDVVGHQVAMLSVHLGVAEIGLPADAEESREALGSARASARSVIAETQQILALLRRGDAVADEEALQPAPALSGLGALVASFRSIGLDVHLRVEVATEDVEPGVGVTVYRVVQEALTNAYRHGDGAATVTVRREAGRLRVDVENRVGPGRDGAAPGVGLGLVGMRERVVACGGELTVASTEGRFVISADLGALGGVLA